MADRTGTYYSIADEAVHGLGAQLLVGDEGSPETFQAIAALTSFTPGEASTADIDITHLRSVDYHREHMPGVRDDGPIALVGTYLPEDESHSMAGGGSGSFTAGGLPYLWKTRALRNFRIELNQPASPNHDYTLRGYVSKFQIGEITVDDKISFTAEIMPTAAYDVP